VINYQNEELGITLYELRSFRIESEVIVDIVGASSNMNEF